MMLGRIVLAGFCTLLLCTFVHGNEKDCDSRRWYACNIAPTKKGTIKQVKGVNVLGKMSKLMLKQIIKNMRQGINGDEKRKREFMNKLKLSPTQAAAAAAAAPTTTITTTTITTSLNPIKSKLTKSILSLLAYVNGKSVSPNSLSKNFPNKYSSRATEQELQGEGPDYEDEKLGTDDEDPTESSQIDDIVREFLTPKVDQSKT